ncbi:MAG: hypothetical protein H6817_08340 [Phycisphaerales bacterium]|nr:hypothetical protein [Phycisphaerales bacterium]
MTFKLLTLCVTLLPFGGCLMGGPSYFPAAPLSATVDASNRAIDVYDTDRDGTGDYSELRSADGRVRLLRFASAGETQEVAFPPQAGEGRQVPQLALVLDSVPFNLVQAAYTSGRFRLFHPPTRIISPFPVMTDICLDEFFRTSPAPGMETEYYDGTETTDGWELYDVQANSPWLASVDWHLPYSRHNQVYMSPRNGFAAELSRIERALADAPGHRLVAYCVGTSAIGFRQSQRGHEWALEQVDRFCHMLVHRMHGDIEITLLSDHGHNLVASRSIGLRERIKDLGYRLARELNDDNDVIVLDFGLVNCAGLHTRQPVKLASELVQEEGVELALYRDSDDGVMVASRDGLARVQRCAEGWRYDCEYGDPLQLVDVVAGLRDSGDVSDDGCIDDAALFAATISHVYPDPLDRCWHAFHGLIAHAPDVYLSLSDGWHWGSPFLDHSVKVAATHGNLNAPSSTGFVMTTAGDLPRTVRMRDLASDLAGIGVSLQDGQLVARSAD